MALTDYYDSIQKKKITQDHWAWLKLEHLARILRANNVADVREFIQQRPQLLTWCYGDEGHDWHHTWTPVDAAIAYGSVDALKVLLEHESAHPDLSAAEAKTEDMWFSHDRLHDACAYGYPDVVRMLLENSKNIAADISRRSCGDVTPLMAALGKGVIWRPVISERPHDREHVVRLLIEHGADPFDCKYVKGSASDSGELYLEYTALTLAATIAKPSLVRYLHSFGLDLFVRTYNFISSDLDEQSTFGVTSLHQACRYRNSDAIRTLLELAGPEANAMLTARDGFGLTPLCWLICDLHQYSTYGVTFETLPLVKDCLAALLEHDPRPSITVNIRTEKGETALDFAAKSNLSNQLIPMLLERGADPKSKNAQGHTVMFSYLSNHHEVSLKVVNLLLSTELETKELDSDTGDSLLHLACRCWKNLEVVKLLLQHNAPVDIKNAKGELPLHVAAACQHICNDNTGNYFVQCRARKAQDVMMTSIVAACGFNPKEQMHCKNKTGKTPFEVLAETGARVESWLKERQQHAAYEALDKVEAAQYKEGKHVLLSVWKDLAETQAELEGIDQSHAASIGRGLARSRARSPVYITVKTRGRGGRRGGSRVEMRPRPRGLSLEMGGSVFI